MDLTVRELRYPSGGLTLTATVIRPVGVARAPVLIWNHGAEGDAAAEHEVLPTRLASELGWLLLYPHRRGFRGSEGEPYAAVHQRWAGRSIEPVLDRLRAEAADVAACLPVVRAMPEIDPSRIAIGGFAAGAVVTLYAAGLAPSSLCAIVSQAAGFPAGPEARRVLADTMARSAWRSLAPVLFQHAADDGIAPVEVTLGAARLLAHLGKPVELRLYPRPVGAADGHDLFRTEYAHLWGPDLEAFLHRGYQSRAERAAVER